MARLGKWARRLLFGALALTLVIACGAWLYWLLPVWGIPFNFTRNGPAPLTPAWALECWLWEDDVNTSEAVLELLNGYEEHDFPVRTILIDSPWSTRYNDFRLDEERYPNPEAFFTGLQDRGYRVVLWMTGMVNAKSDDTAIQESADWYGEAAKNGFLVNGEFQAKWWKGRGGFIDYTNPEAMTWWRGLQQQVFDWGIDGWKLDGAATLLIKRDKIPWFYHRAHKGLITTRGYMDHYYRDEYEHGLSQNPDFITLARAMDRYWHPEGFAPLDASPVTWVGDQDHAWTVEDEGIEEALTDIMRSAKRGYCVIGSDVGGYGGGTIPANVYIRWAQFSAFCGLFLNGGHGERAMWKRSDEELQIIRKYAWLHTELVPYIYNHVVECHEGGAPLMRPTKGKYHYFFGDAFLVAPIYQDSLTHTVELPKGRWRYLFNDTEVIQGPATLTRDYPMNEFPVFVRDGAIVPLNVSRPYTGFGGRDSEGYLTFALYPHGAKSFTLHHPEDGEQTTVEMRQEDGLAIALGGAKKPHILRVLLEEKPGEVRLDDELLEEGKRWHYDASTQRLVIKTSEYDGGRYAIR